MDPTQALTEILQALANGQRQESLDAMRDLSDWIRRGGFFPDCKRAVIQAWQGEVRFDFPNV